jgi:membrane-associated phospholipid phosphatase
MRQWREEVEALDVAVYAAIAGAATPTLDRGLRRLSRAADHSKLWIGAAAVMAGAGGAAGRRGAASGLSALALTSAVVNLALKPLGGRRRPDRAAYRIPRARQVEMPRSTSFPSGHSASAFAFAGGVGRVLPVVGVPLHLAAGLVAYSRVHTGVHYPLDALAGMLVGEALAPVTPLVTARLRASAYRLPGIVRSCRHS